MLQFHSKFLVLPLAGCFLALNLPPAVAADSCITAACHQAIGGLKNLHQPVKDGDCGSCHQQKAKEHPLKGSKSFELTAKGAALCSQCHDAKGKKKVVHPPVNEGDCLACHKPHGGSGRFLLDVGADRTELCLGCHDSATFKQKFMHGPVAAGACTNCHDPHESANKFLLKEPNRELCLKCHADFGKAESEATVIHDPVKLNQCFSCHEPHGAANSSLLKKTMPELCTYCHKKVGEKMANAKVPHKPLLQQGGCTTCHSPHFAKAKGLLAADDMTVCLNCHGNDKLGTPPLKNIKKELEGKKYLHGPIKEGRCTPCHDPHGSNFFRILRGNYPADLYAPYRDGIYDGCLICHEKNLLRFPDTTVYTKFRNGNRNLHFVHVADIRKGRTCRLCHEPHASDGPKLTGSEGSRFGIWKIPFRLELTGTGGRCSSGCHQSLGYDRVKPVIYSPNETPGSK
jgi:predicted CXXCH cytochrome family protein